MRKRGSPSGLVQFVAEKESPVVRSGGNLGVESVSLEITQADFCAHAVRKCLPMGLDELDQLGDSELSVANTRLGLVNEDGVGNHSVCQVGAFVDYAIDKAVISKVDVHDISVELVNLAASGFQRVAGTHLSVGFGHIPGEGDIGCVSPSKDSSDRGQAVFGLGDSCRDVRRGGECFSFLHGVLLPMKFPTRNRVRRVRGAQTYCERGKGSMIPRHVPSLASYFRCVKTPDIIS